MMYMSGHVCAARHPNLGFMLTPAMGNRLPDGEKWCGDTGCFAKPEAHDDAKYLAWIAARDHRRCLFATAPDVLANYRATVERSLPLLPKIRDMGYPAALVAQDGWDSDDAPWDEFDVLFIGGTNKFKLEESTPVIREAKNRGKWVHMGRVNTWNRLRFAEMMSCDSADGTMLAFGPDINTPILLGWLERQRRQPTLSFNQVN